MDLYMKNIELMLNNYSSSNLYNIPNIPKQTFNKIPKRAGSKTRDAQGRRNVYGAK